MNIIYNGETGEIDRVISDDQDYRIFYSLFPEEYINKLACLQYVEKLPILISDYYIKDLKLIKYSDKEIKEIKEYNRILTEEERINILLMPSQQEIQKAKNTIEILSLLQEVM